ncbi:MAG: periplasmic heavy metal sensor [Bacteroidales bacterium]
MMKASNKRTLIITGIIFITVINLAALGTQLYRSYFQPRVSNRAERADFRPEHMHDGFHRQFIEQMDFSEKQAGAFRTIMRKTFQESRPVIDQLHLKRRELLTVLSGEVVDTVNVNFLAEEIGRLHAELKKISASHYMELRKLCTPQQQEQLLQFYDKMIPQQPRGERRGRNWQHRRNNDEREPRESNRRMRQNAPFE